MSTSNGDLNHSQCSDVIHSWLFILPGMDILPALTSVWRYLTWFRHPIWENRSELDEKTQVRHLFSPLRTPLAPQDLIFFRKRLPNFEKLQKICQLKVNMGNCIRRFRAISSRKRLKPTKSLTLTPYISIS